ncbi:hypothetical protein [Piscirickettsia litoralis]|uniref:Uncharacterized protein n=1 Tax=Piscirickettsia litoralis TaxID=1891921 RepID=A0ABX2ZYI8_9GAMM|nr:hypothetical protein [Piscirickettsia litoralis]ODN41686.1 hypothetical protein BGC07_00180 [Piscirickettsia litoralis]
MLTTLWSKRIVIAWIPALLLAQPSCAYVYGGSNFSLGQYPEVDCGFKPIKPQKPYYHDSYAIQAYNNEVMQYNYDIQQYISCVKEYLENAKNDIQRIQDEMQEAIDKANR